MSMKTCVSCKLSKNLNCFGANANYNDGLRTDCRDCRAVAEKRYRRSKKGLVAKIYNAQVMRSKGRGHDRPSYSKSELRDWLFSQDRFHILYDNWKRLDYQKDYIPSVDRKDDYIGYNMSNIQLMTWQENNDKGHRDMKSGTNSKTRKAVCKYAIDGTLVAEYPSVTLAAEAEGCKKGLISNYCKSDTAIKDGYVWKYKVWNGYVPQKVK